jgi:hypothetical protein
MPHDPWAMNPNTPIDESQFGSQPVGVQPVLAPGFTKTRCHGCKQPIILETADPVEQEWNPTPITGSDLTIAKILGRELLKITVGKLFIRFESVFGDPDPHSWYLEAHDCLTAPIATTEPSTTSKHQKEQGSWQQETLL